LNLGDGDATLAFDGAGTVELSTHASAPSSPVAGRVGLRPNEGVVMRLSA